MLADEHPCYARCGQTTSVGEARPIRMRFIECGDNNWCVALAVGRVVYVNSIFQAGTVVL